MCWCKYKKIYVYLYIHIYIYIYVYIFIYLAILQMRPEREQMYANAGIMNISVLNHFLHAYAYMISSCRYLNHSPMSISTALARAKINCSFSFVSLYISISPSTAIPYPGEKGPATTAVPATLTPSYKLSYSDPAGSSGQLVLVELAWPFAPEDRKLPPQTASVPKK